MSNKTNKKELFAKLPSVDEVLGDERIVEICENLPRSIVVESVRGSIDKFRKKIVSLKDEEVASFSLSEEDIILDSIITSKKSYELSLKNVINATGIVVHTNLGRSLLSEKIKDELWGAASRYSNLEYDIEEGKRGSRYTHLTDMIKRITGAEDVLVVNNNAAAVLLILSTMAKGGEAIVSRGELVEVGGAFRIPSIMALSGADLVEVGSTNKTHYSDYEDAITENTKVLMKVHTSNYRIVGFSESVSLEEMRSLGDLYAIPVVEDLGSGVLIDLSKYGMAYEPTVFDSIEKGVDIVSFSGDKMLGGPQAGIIVGKKKFIEKMKKNQLTRALRVDKMTIAALEATLRFYLDEEKAIKEIPTLRMLTYTKEEINKKVDNLYKVIMQKSGGNLDAEISIEDCKGQVGGGSMPTEELESKAVVIKPHNISVSKLEEKLRLGNSHIIARVYDEKYVLDVRTIFEEQYENIANELKTALSKN
ncbi:L-seryl-tRNA(Sec) selenium transferase [Peptostreptococcus canis]|uniref:L-seryl-tRNA(Sec) selenium transferase n=1 Tax=Peptostreptococcus canis TaxID=1159213 RepID=A0ABR6TLL7_9FIRM|nr:L-seryl-tRNA(Sec) selenium transferase [Peptostreptococcus canis]MBC2576048.1 L-seryl-tRNA(Sec) selenium transferase [Peptostreptococcus canis]MBP1997826.1 L-seryl-tRNA(Ser) seleniumtransferase [Peptostreptococcus canis]